MPIPCPCCRASNDTGPACRRCKADLSLLFAVEADRAARVESARRLVAEGRHADAAAALAQADQSRRTDEAARLRAAVLLLAGDFPAALRAYDLLKAES
jgi:hypothetical protein